MVISDIVYDVIVEPPGIGSTQDRYTGAVRPVVFMPGLVNSQYIIEGLSFGFMFVLDGVGIILLDLAFDRNRAKSIKALHALLSVLDDRGKREALLIASLEKREEPLRQAMSSKMANNSEIRHSTISDQSELERDDSSNNLCLTEISKDSLAQSTAINIEVGRKVEKQEQNWSCLQPFDAWIWNYFYLDLQVVKHSKRSYLDSLAIWFQIKKHVEAKLGEY